MKKLTKQTTLFALILTMLASLAIGVSFMSLSKKSYAEGSSYGIIADFTAADTKKLNKADGMPLSVAGFGQDRFYDSMVSYLTNVDTDGDSVVDAETAFKAKLGGYTSAWITTGIKFTNPNPIKLSDVASVSVRYYLKSTKNTLLFFAGPNDNYVKALNSSDWVSATKNAWVTETLLADRLSYLADADGNITSIGISVGYNGGSGYYDADAYLLLDSITFTPVAKNTVDFKVDGETVETFTNKPGETVIMPAMQNTAEKAFIGWVNGNDIYKAGTEITVSEDAVYNALYLDFTTEDKASARLAQPYGLRFISSIDKAEHESLKALTNVAYTLGTKITSDYSSMSIDIPCTESKMYEKDGKLCFNAVVANILEENFVRIYHANAYMNITYSDGDTATIYAAKGSNEGRSYAQVLDEMASLELEDLEIVDELYTAVKESETLLPSISITVDGEKVSAAQFATELNAYFAQVAYKIGDQVDITDISFDGYTLNEAESVLSGTMSLRGVELKIALNSNNG